LKEKIIYFGKAERFQIQTQTIFFAINSLQVFKMLTEDATRKVILLNYQNNYVEQSNQLLEYQNFLHYSLFLMFQQNYIIF